MYCRDTTDAATADTSPACTKLKTYYAGQTKITDRSLDDPEPDAVARNARVLELPPASRTPAWPCSRLFLACARSASTGAGR